ncbi:GyrI-like domain-containing protein [Nocardiopsis trehalosi]|jgi:effector-binding domain-containing protein|uniref:GyrI-like domain-containing protein n=1 Tax=Nocardiopsis trehalosi TaxID=109329 RepID=UPI000829B7F7|nr:GyrI-like domain-containing protein [Nocardiopsis trehalosi]
MTETPRIEDRPARPYASTRRTVTLDGFAEIADRIPEMIGILAERGIAPAAGPFFRYRTFATDRPIEVEAGVPVAVAFPGDDRLECAELPAGRYAIVHHHGHPDQLLGVFDDLLAWGAEQGIIWDAVETPEGTRWGCRTEAMLTDPRVEPDLNKWESEISLRLADSD